MKTVRIYASKSYDVQIGFGLLNQLGSYASSLHAPCKAAIISDSNVWPLYGATAVASLKDSGYFVCNFVFPAGETSKNGTTYLSILNFLAENTLSRSDLVIALGGGVVGDMTGFVAATYLRGVNYIQVPTTLLAMVDSSVGGKTAIDLPAGKNLAGAFCQPALVLCDLNTLDTLPGDIFRDGCAEVIKYGVLFDEPLFTHLEEAGLQFNREDVICRCVAWKRDVVAKDEFDTGLRQLLNLGHTIGHGVEVQSHFAVSHGQAVAIGMAIIARAYCNAAVSERICKLLEAFSLPITTEFSAEQLFSSALSDKKRSGDFVNLIVPERIGYCKIQPTPLTHLQSMIEAGL